MRFSYLKIEVERLHQVGALWKALVFSHIIAKRKVPVSSFSLRKEPTRRINISYISSGTVANPR